MSLRRLLSLVVFSGLSLSPCAFAGTKLLRFPDLCGGKVVFTYAGDLWTASTQGGTATRLTAGPASSSRRASRRIARASRSPANTAAMIRSM